MKFRHQACWFVPAVVLVCGGLVSVAAEAQFFQQAPKLVGTGVIGPYGGTPGPLQGDAVSLSGDGNTAIIGGRFDNSATGAAWVFTRAGGVWSQQAKLVPAVVRGEGGTSVALSGDGNTAIVGGIGSVSNQFAADGATVFTRVGGVWSRQARLVGTGILQGSQGASVALSGDGNTAIVGGPGDNSGGEDVGAAWVFTRSGGVWSQQAKLVGTGGTSVALSGDGNTAIVGDPGDNSNAGATWVFTRSAGVWSQQAKLVGTGAVGSANQGDAVSLSGDGNTVLVGGRGDNGGIGAAWVFTQAGELWNQQVKLVGVDVSAGPFPSTGTLSSDGNTAIFVGDGAALIYTRSGGVWTQQEQLVGTGAVGTLFEGGPVSLSSDGKTALVGGPGDNGGMGAAWVFAPLAGTPGTATCVGQSIRTLIREFGGFNSAAASTDFPSVMALQNAIMAYCAGSDQVASTLP
jgi:hypothetical protein